MPALGWRGVFPIRTSLTRVLADILRKYPRCASKVVPKIAALFKNIDKASGKVVTAVHSSPRFGVARAQNRGYMHARLLKMQAAVIWMIGEYGQLVEDAPYILEGLIDNFANEQARIVRLEVCVCVCVFVHVRS